MNQDDFDKRNALEEFLEESIRDPEQVLSHKGIPDQTITPRQPTEHLEDEIKAEDTLESTEFEEPKPKPRRKKKQPPPPPIDDETLVDRLSGLTTSALRFAKKTTKTSMKVGKALIHSQDQLKLMLAAGQSLKDLREVAGLTRSELNEALNLKDKSLLEAVEDGTSTLSFELILRLSALLARNDPIPFIIKYTRTYNPEIWKILSDWGLGRIPLQYEREREFINIFRAHDEARKLSDDGYKKVLEFTRKAFEMSLHFIAEQENVDIESEEVSGDNETSQTTKTDNTSSSKKSNSKK